MPAHLFIPRVTTRFLIAFLFCIAAVVSASAQTFVILHQFDGTDGSDPTPSLVQGFDGDFYGTTYNGAGSNYYGTFFKIGRYGKVTTLYSFCSETNCDDGENPDSGLVVGPDGTFYGNTLVGGTYGKGIVFKAQPGAPAAPLYNFCALTNCDDGWQPDSLVWGWDGSLYGTTNYGGTGTLNGGTAYPGIIFRLSPAGALDTLHIFCQQTNCPDGFAPGGLIQGADGNLYGLTYSGGTGGGGDGTIFKIGPGQPFQVLYNFCSETNCTDGIQPQWLVWGADGNLYGTTFGGGTAANGTVFKISPAGGSPTVYSLPADSPSFSPFALVQGTDGNFYGTTLYAANDNPGGAIFKITAGGTLTWLHVLANYEGVYPEGLIQGTDGAFYGTAREGGGASSQGTVFRFDVGLSPFVRAINSFGRIGARVTILGTDLTGATAVSFNGTAAIFTVPSATEIVTTVPTGATSGTITVTTPTGTLNSNVAFTVLP
jgi:uncharacterized repeat protein (TIGR03803 family)